MSTETTEPGAGDVEALAALLDRVNGRTLTDKARTVLASDWLAQVRRETGERIAQGIEGAIEAHRKAGNRLAVAALAPLPDLAREEASRG